MYLASNVHITFPEFRGRKGFAFKTVNSFETEKSWQNLTDTAKFIIAKQLYFDEKGKVFELVKPGDPFIIEAGYNGQLNKEFEGFISEVLDDLPVVFKGEDNMYVLKRTPVNKSYGSVKLENLLRDIVPPQFKIDAMDVVIGSVLYQGYTVAGVLTDLKEQLGLYSYFVGDTLVCGKIYTDNPETQTVKYTFTKNIHENDLKYRRKDDIRLKVTMTSHLSNGKKIKATVGDDDGEEQKLICTNVSDKEALEKLAQKELDRLKINGYSGTLTGYGLPYVTHGYTAIIKNLENPEKDGSYYVDSVTTTFNDQGAIRRIAKIGPSAVK